MAQREVNITGGPNNTKALVTGLQELLVKVGASSGLATEATLQSVLTALQAFTEYEARLVIDANDDVFLEVRVWDEDSGTWATTPTYYAVGSNVAATPVAPIRYADSTLLLTPTQKTSNIIRSSGQAAQTLAAGSFSASFASVGTADATVEGVALKSGETVNFDAGAINNTLGAIDYDTSTAGAELLIIHIT